MDTHNRSLAAINKNDTLEEHNDDVEEPKDGGEKQNGDGQQKLLIPERMRPTLQRLQAESKLSTADIISIVFIVRLIDSLHSCFYATFLSLSYVEELKRHLHVAELDAEMEVYATRWSWRDGEIVKRHRISFDFDMDVIHTLTQLAAGVLNDDITPEEALLQMNELEKGNTDWNRFELFYRNLPGRILVFPLIAMSCSIAYFNGTWVDAGWATLTGLLAGFIHYLASRRPHIADMEDLVVSIVVGMVSSMTITVLPDSSCFNAQVLATLFWYLYGTAFMVSLYEIYNKQVITGVTRLAIALINSYGLAFGVSIGLWLAWYAGSDRYLLAGRSCDGLDHQVSEAARTPFYILSCFGALMQFRVGVRQWFLCILIQAVGVSTQYLIGTLWGQPSFIANVIPTYAVTVSAHILLTLTRWFDLSSLQVPIDAYRRKTFRKQSTTTTTTTTTLPETDQASSPQKKSMFSYASIGWSYGQQRSGYMRYHKRHYKCTDLWFCILPAIYLLVPGSSVFSYAFSQIWETGSASDAGNALFPIFVIGLSQAIGVRLALATMGLGIDGYIEVFAQKMMRHQSSSEH